MMVLLGKLLYCLFAKQQGRTEEQEYQFWYSKWHLLQHMQILRSTFSTSTDYYNPKCQWKEKNKQGLLGIKGVRPSHKWILQPLVSLCLNMYGLCACLSNSTEESNGVTAFHKVVPVYVKQKGWWHGDNAGLCTEKHPCGNQEGAPGCWTFIWMPASEAARQSSREKGTAEAWPRWLRNFQHRNQGHSLLQALHLNQRLFC